MMMMDKSGQTRTNAVTDPSEEDVTRPLEDACCSSAPPGLRGAFTERTVRCGPSALKPEWSAGGGGRERRRVIGGADESLQLRCFRSESSAVRVSVLHCERDSAALLSAFRFCTSLLACQSETV
ncbi:hypothetical protein Q5P01_021872 [Channa striata]|uniref:Uncharacterized protein n=1 Tax=Channa striata TaxID=64152 RepID=A0AA88LVV3_CHASR|nr:hypothetical protein Q5P01_021872 [Channa striata]